MLHRGNRAALRGLVLVVVAAVCPAWAGDGRAASLSAHRAYTVPVLIYHHIKWTRPGDDAIERGLTIYPSQLTAQLAYLQSHGYHTTTAAVLVDALRGKGRLPSRPVVLTFDDGYRDVYANAYRVLLRHHMTATFFICPGFLGSLRYLSWTQVEDMARHGMDIEAHTVSHPDLRTVPAQQARGEIVQSRQILQSRLHRPVRVFAYPYGAYNATILADVARAGYWGAFTTHPGWVQSTAQLLTLPRVYANHSDVPAVTPSMYSPAP